jgi:putative ABC transport system permease protein
LTDGLWQRRFGGDPAITGKQIRLNGHDFTVVGVTAQGFRGTTPVGGPELWVPFAMNQQLLASGLPAEQYRSRRGLTYQAFGRLKDGVTLEQARANVDSIGQSLAAAFPNEIAGDPTRSCRLPTVRCRRRSASSWCYRER